MNEQALPPDLVVGPTVMAADGELPAMWHISLKLKAVHESGIDGSGVTFSINDTGVFEEHGYFGNQEFDFEHFNSAGGGMNDRNGHGTHCFGITTSVAPGSVGIWAKVLSDRGSGSTTGIDRGRVHAAKQGADVISESLGDGGGPVIRDSYQAIETAYSEGASICVAAAGNAGFSGRGSSGGRHASYDNAWCQGATKRDGSIASFSSGGKTLDAATPGQNIVSCGLKNSWHWVTMSGTSMATPFMAGIFCLIIQKRRIIGKPDLIGRNAWIEFMLQEGFMEDRGDEGHDPRFGHGVPSIDKILDALIDPEWV